MKRNVASQIVCAQMLAAADGSDFTSAVSVFVTGDGGTKTAGAGTVTHEGDGQHSYVPTQAETDYAHVAFQFKATGAITATLQVYPSFPQTGDNFALIGATGAGLTSLASAANLSTVAGYLDTEVAAILAAVDTEVAAIKTKTDFLPSATAGAAGGLFIAGSNAATTVNFTGTITTVTTLTNLPAITAGWITAAGIAASALNGKGDWNVGKTGYSLTQGFPSNFSSMSITAGGLVDITQTAADKAWGTAARILTAGTNIALAKGTGVTGFNDPDAAAIADAVWDEAIAGHVVVGSTGINVATACNTVTNVTYGNSALKTLIDAVDNFVDTEIAALTTTIGAAGAGLTALATQASVDAIDDYLDTEIAAIKAKTDALPSDPADASDIAASFTALSAKVDTIDDFLDTEIGAIKAKTDNLPVDPADASDIAASFATVNTSLTSAHTKLDTIDDLIDTEIGAIKTETATIQAGTSDIQARLPAALVGGRMDSNLSAISSSTTTLAAFNRAVKGNVIGTVGVGSTTTSIVTSSVTPAGSVADKFKGRYLIFADDTTTANLRGQGTDITANTSAAAPTFTVTPLTTAPVSTDTFVIV